MAIKVTWQDIIKLMQQGEGPALEFIPTIKNSKDLTKVLVSFANAQGGTVVAGIDDKNGHLNGVDISKEWVTTICKNECEPAINAQVGEFIRNEKKIIVMQVKEGNNKPYRTTDGNVLTREGVKTREASIEEQKELNPWGVGGINPRQKKGLNFITENTSISNKQYREICDVSHKTAHIELTELVEKGVLQVEGQGRSTVYVLASKEISATTPPATETESEQALPNNGQLFQFEEEKEAAELKEKIEEPKVEKPAPAKTAIKRPKKVKKQQKKEITKVVKEDIPLEKEPEEEAFEPPVREEEPINEASETKEDSPPIVAGDDYADTRPSAKAPEIDEEDDAANPSFLDI
ncbi:RNA-binding domain-containing protein [Candidatus Margulisiibacteriota bacterium]